MNLARPNVVVTVKLLDGRSFETAGDFLSLLRHRSGRFFVNVGGEFSLEMEVSYDEFMRLLRAVEPDPWEGVTG